jgi:hypothetical protein
VEEVLLGELLLLLEPVGEERELGLEGPPVGVLVEALQKRVLLEPLQHEPPAEAPRHLARERRLPRADHALDDHVAQPLAHAREQLGLRGEALDVRRTRHERTGGPQR